MNNIDIVRAMEVAHAVASKILTNNNGTPRSKAQVQFILHMLSVAVAALDVQEDATAVADCRKWCRVVPQNTQGGGRHAGNINASNRSK